MKKNIDRLHDKKWGIFNHYLNDGVNSKNSIKSYGRQTDWDTCVHEFDVKKLAKQLADIGVGYYFITIMQGTSHLIAPNATYDKIAGTKPGEACSTRDLPMELADELAKYDIDLYLYFTGDGPYKTEEIGKKFGYTEPRLGNVNEAFIEKWASVLEEYAVRYGDKVKGWWIDGCYDYFGYTNDMLIPYKKAIEKGNPDAIATFNNGHLGGFTCQWDLEDYTCGETNELYIVPKERFIDGKKQGHVLAGIGASPNPYGRWACPGACAYNADYLCEYIDSVTKNGGVVTLDTAVYRDGWIDPCHYDVLKQTGDKLKKIWNK